MCILFASHKLKDNLLGRGKRNDKEGQLENCNKQREIIYMASDLWLILLCSFTEIGGTMSHEIPKIIKSHIFLRENYVDSD